MLIHTVQSGDTIFKIARKYGSSPMKIIENNELENPDRLTVGQKLLILTPTRTYTVRGRDTLDGIAERFEVKREALQRNNPYLCGGEKLYPGQILAIKYDAPNHGIGVANGYYYNGCDSERLSLCLPYLTYLTVSCGAMKDNRVNFAFDDSAIIKQAKNMGVRCIFRIYSDSNSLNKSYIPEIMNAIKSHGYDGATIAAYRAAKESRVEYVEFLRELNEALKKDALFLLTEIDGNEYSAVPDICDGYVTMYSKSGYEKIPTFKEGEEALFENICENGEPSKTYIEIPSLGYIDNEEIHPKDAVKIACSSALEILNDDESKISYFYYNKYIGGKRERVRASYESLDNVKAKLDMIGELGFMGIVFDIMRIPIEYLMTFSASFQKPTLYSDM